MAMLGVVKVQMAEDQLVRELIRLRRARPGTEDAELLAGVRSRLEGALGRTVTRAVAARTLGISQTALGTWIERGEISTVMTHAGRRRVPLRELLDLAGAVETHRETSPDDPYPLATVLRLRREGIERMDPEQVLPRRYRREDRSGHRRAELRGLAYHRAAAQRLDAGLVADARARLHEWLEQGKIDPRHAAQWERVLSRPIPSIARAISEDSQFSRDLRQSSPLTGVLSEPERRKILEIVG